jgi:hypothetical protein
VKFFFPALLFRQISAHSFDTNQSIDVKNGAIMYDGNFMRSFTSFFQSFFNISAPFLKAKLILDIHSLMFAQSNWGGGGIEGGEEKRTFELRKNFPFSTFSSFSSCLNFQRLKTTTYAH